MQIRTRTKIPLESICDKCELVYLKLAKVSGKRLFGRPQGFQFTFHAYSWYIKSVQMFQGQFN